MPRNRAAEAKGGLWGRAGYQGSGAGLESALWPRQGLLEQIRNALRQKKGRAEALPSLAYG